MTSILQAIGDGLGGALGAAMLPLWPAFVAWAAATLRDEWGDADAPPPGAVARLAASAALFALAFGLSFAALNAGDGLLIRQARGFTLLAGAIVAAYGLHILGAAPIPGLRRAARAPAWRVPAKFIASLCAGFALAFGWTPIPGPGLAAAADASRLALATYGVFLCWPVWLAIVLVYIGLARKSPVAPAALHRLEAIAGLVLIATGVLIAAGFLAEFGFALDERLAFLAHFG
jgi:cytochrome c-type biogenesis protein